jgi:Cof subfamily protein (haloacid dehalogenase superfamily)
MNLPKLIAVDLDGTLLPSSKRITPKTREVLRRLVARGTRVTLATGKFQHLTITYSEELELCEPLISLDGAHVGGNGHADEKECLPLDSARDLVDRYQHLATHVFADSGEDELLLRSNREEFVHATRNWADRVRLVTDLRQYITAPPTILSFYGDDEVMDEVARSAKALISADGESTVRVAGYWSEILECRRISLQPRGVSKGSAVASVAARLGIAVEDCMVFGDWHNDLSMFSIGAVGVAMKNAVDEVKAAADFVTEQSCEEDGVAHFLEHQFL